MMTTLKLLKKKGQKPISMLTCYDYQTAQVLNSTDLDMILVGDSLGNVVLGLDTTIPVTLQHMEIFAQAVRRGAPNKFIVVDMPFGSYAHFESAIENATELFQKTGAQAVKLEGASQINLEIIKRLTEVGVPVAGHIGLMPQSVHQMGGYYTHGKNEIAAQALLKQAKELEQAGCFTVILECIEAQAAKAITQALHIPTIGIGSGQNVDGQVLVVNDLFHMGKDTPPKFCTPIANLFNLKKEKINQYLEEL